MKFVMLNVPKFFCLLILEFREKPRLGSVAIVKRKKQVLFENNLIYFLKVVPIGTCVRTGLFQNYCVHRTRVTGESLINFCTDSEV